MTYKKWTLCCEDEQLNIVDCVAYKEGLYKNTQSNGPLKSTIKLSFLHSDKEKWSEGLRTYTTTQVYQGKEMILDRNPIVLKTKIMYEYKGHFVRACNRWRFDELRYQLYREFEQNLKTYDLHNTLLTSWD
jgi:hypothetical protein